jgi:D-aminoacyl-tRNA deacylase
MIGLLQRVREASVLVAGETVGAIGPGLMILVGVERGDTERTADRLVERILSFRVFPDEAGRMNLSVVDVKGGVLLVPQFTLPADTRKGTRPSFTPAAPPEQGRRLFDRLLARARARHAVVEAGCFGADMDVASINHGPATFWLRVNPDAGPDES